MKKFIAALLCCCAAAFLTSISTIPASAVKTTCTTYDGSNAEGQNYSTYASPVESYLTKSSSGGLMRVQGDAVDGKILIEYYDSSYNITSSKKISAELPIFGGFYETKDNYYILSGQTNPNEKDTVEVYRITKYDKNWKKIKSCGLYGANTYIPFDAGSARMTDDGEYLLIRTCHEMYKSSDGYHHQANVTIQVDMANMKITDSYTDVMNSAYGYVSHSFNQFIKAENGHIIAVDHGDAYPRSIVLTEYNTDYTTGSFTPDWGSFCTTTDLLTFPGKEGDNYTGASVGGFEISDSKYIVAGNYVGDSNFDNSSTRNIFVATLSKDASSDRKPTVKMITSYTSGTTSTPHLVKIAANSYILLWSHDGKVYYTRLDSSGNKSGSIYSMSGELSDCAPVLYNNKLVWYVWENETVTFYRISTTSISNNAKTVINNGHKFTTKVAANSNIAVQTCTQCGFQKKITILTDYTVFWNQNGGIGYYWSVCDDTYHPGDTLMLLISYPDPVDNDDMVYEISNSSVAQLSGTKYSTSATITMKAEGTFTLKIYPRYNTSCVQKYTFTVKHEYDSGKVTKAATYGATGTKTYTCTVCGAKKTSSIAKKTVKTVTAKTDFTCTSSAIRINWNKLSGVSGYRLYRYDSAKKTWVGFANIYDPNATNYKVSGLSAGTIYKFKVKAFVKENGKTYFGTASSTITTATKPKTTTITKSNKVATAVRLYWNKLTCTGYRIDRYDSAQGKWVKVKAVEPPSTTQYRISGLKKNTTYKFRIVPYVKVGNKYLYGAASKTYTVKTTK